MEAPPNISFAAMLDASPDAILLVDADGEVRYANERVRDLFGYEPAEIVGEQIEQLVPTEHRDEHVTHREAYMSDPSRRPVGVGRELAARRKDGSTVPVEISLSPLEERAEEYVFVSVRDVSERQKYHQQVTRLREATRQLIDAETKERIAELVAVAAKDIFGYESCVSRVVNADQQLRPVAVVGGEEVGIDERPDYAIDGENPVARAHRTGEAKLYDDVQELGDGHDRGVSRGAMYVPIGDHGVLSIVDPEVGAFDPTDLKLASNLATNAETILDRIHHERELERQIDRLDEFASVVSHDLRNPLNVAQLRLDFAADAMNGDLEGDHIDSVGEALERMEEVVEDTLTLARQGNVVGETEPVAVTTLIERSWDRLDAAEATLEVVDDVRVCGDPGRLEHVFENLLSNAVSHGGAGVTVRVGSLSEAAGIYVEDDGPGIPEDERDRIFEAGHTTAADGTGFGLAIVRQIVDAHGWEVLATTSSAGGARFEITGVEFADSGR